MPLNRTSAVAPSAAWKWKWLCKRPIIIRNFLLLSAIAVAPAIAASAPLISVCYDYGCKSSRNVRLPTKEWAQIQQIFSPGAASATEERGRIAEAIATMEREVGALAGTDADLGGNVTGSGMQGQMDCIDESVNTTTYLYLLDKLGWLRWHRVEPRAKRAKWVLDQHWTAVIRDTEDNQSYAVDSWFLDNGKQPFIQPLADWQAKRKLPPNQDAGQDADESRKRTLNGSDSGGVGSLQDQ